MIPRSTSERVRLHRQRLQLHRAAVAAELARRVPARVLAEHLVQLAPSQLDALAWALADAAGVSSPGNKRKLLDAYFTEPRVASAVTARVAELVPDPRKILEPSAGLGAFVRAAIERWSSASITAVDVRLRAPLRKLWAKTPVPYLHLVKEDFLRCPRELRFDLVLGNPPFRSAEDHIEHALSLLNDGGVLAFLLPTSFEGSIGRARGLWQREGLFYKAVIAPRPSFVGGGTDKVEYALFAWKRGYVGDARTGKPIIWREKKLEPTKFKRPCAVPFCPRVQVIKGLCPNHYGKARKLGLAGNELQPADLEQLAKDRRTGRAA